MKNPIASLSRYAMLALAASPATFGCALEIAPRGGAGDERAVEEALDDDILETGEEVAAASSGATASEAPEELFRHDDLVGESVVAIAAVPRGQGVFVLTYRAGSTSEEARVVVRRYAASGALVGQSPLPAPAGSALPRRAVASPTGALFVYTGEWLLAVRPDGASLAWSKRVHGSVDTRALAFQPRSNEVVLAAVDTRTMKPFLSRFDGASGKRVAHSTALDEGPAYPDSLALMPEGRVAVYSPLVGRVCVLDANGALERPCRTIRDGASGPTWGGGITYSPDDQSLVATYGVIASADKRGQDVVVKLRAKTLEPVWRTARSNLGLGTTAYLEPFALPGGRLALGGTVQQNLEPQPTPGGLLSSAQRSARLELRTRRGAVTWRWQDEAGALWNHPTTAWDGARLYVASTTRSSGAPSVDGTPRSRVIAFAP